MGPVISKQLRLSRRGLLLGTVPASLALAACAPESSPIKKIENTKPSATPAHSETSPLSSPLKSDPKRWGFVGDSTSAAGVARAFAEVTGLPVSDSSIAGTTSLNALARTGAFDFKCSLENNTLKGSDKTKVLDVTPVNPFLSNGWDFSASINGVPGSIVRDYDTSEMLFTPDKPGKDIENLVNPPLKLDPYGPTNPFTQVTTNGYSMIIGLGRNDLKANGPSVDEVIDNIKSIIDQNIAEDVNYVVWDVPRGVGTLRELKAGKISMNGIIG